MHLAGQEGGHAGDRGQGGAGNGRGLHHLPDDLGRGLISQADHLAADVTANCVALCAALATTVTA